MNGDLLIRLADVHERGSLEALQLRASLVWPQYRQALLDHPDAIDLPIDQIEAGYVHVCERAGVAIGFTVVLPRQDGRAELDGLFVEPSLWRAGVGTRLMREAMRIAVGFGASELHVVANPNAEGFYLACGFERRDVEQTRFGAAMGMALPLKAHW